MTFTLILRRIHMYLALFLTPWVLIYGLSTLSLNHMSLLSSFYGDNWGQSYVERTTTYDKPLPTVPDPQDEILVEPKPRIDVEAAAKQVLQDLGMDGAHWAGTAAQSTRLVINRNDIIAPREITVTPADHTLVIKRQAFQWPMFLRRLHTRRSYAQPYLADWAWAFVLDLLIVSILVWGLTGLWMWYQMKPTRRWGTLCAAAGCILFAFFLVTI
jgi:hypothetical protein